MAARLFDYCDSSVTTGTSSPSKTTSVPAQRAMKIHRQLHWGALVASIESLVVDERDRSGGIGAALVEAAVESARASQCKLVELHSNEHRTQARRFYERQGFEVTGNYFVRQL